MSFEDNLRTITGSLATAQRQALQSEEQARKVVAFHGPHMLRRFADMAAAFDTPALSSGQGAILARRDAHGYHTVEFAASDLHIVLDVTDGEAHLSWLAGGKADDRLITIETPDATLDAMLLEAVSAYVKARAAAPNGSVMMEERRDA